MKQRLEEGPVIRREKRYMYLSSRIYGIAKQLIKNDQPRDDHAGILQKKNCCWAFFLQ